MASPLVEWIGGHPPHSISHWQILKKANEIYGDVFTAIGVINFVFRFEATSGDAIESSNRDERSFLASRMQPLFPGSQEDHAGRNYHFWNFLTAGLKQGGTKLARIYTNKFEKSQGDRGDHAADILALDTVDKVIANISSPNAKECLLDRQSQGSSGQTGRQGAVQ